MLNEDAFSGITRFSVSFGSAGSGAASVSAGYFEKILVICINVWLETKELL